MIKWSLIDSAMLHFTGHDQISLNLNNTYYIR